MALLLDWAAHRALQWTEGKLRQVMGLPIPAAVSSQYISELGISIKALRRAPYLSALEHFKNRNKKACYERLVDAVVVDELDSAAQLMYIHLLRSGWFGTSGSDEEERDAQLRNALESSFRFLDRFGYRGDCVPEEVFKDWLDGQSVQANGLGAIREFDCDYDYFPNGVWCTGNGLAVQARRSSDWTRACFGASQEILFARWNGKVRSVCKSKHASILALTNSYLVTRERIDNPSSAERPVYRLEQVTESRRPEPIAFLSDEEVKRLFGVPTEYQLHLDASRRFSPEVWHPKEPLEILQFCGIRLNCVALDRPAPKVGDDYGIGQPLWRWGRISCLPAST